MNTAPDTPDPILERYLDGDLTPEEKLECERRMDARPELRAALADQARIDDSIRRSFALPAPPAVLAAAGRVRAAAPLVVKPGPRAPSRRRLLVALAASLALSAVGVWRIALALTPPKTGYGPRLAMETVYQDAVAGRLDAWSCRDQREFAATFLMHYGEAIVLGTLPQGVEASGLAYAHTLSPKTICLLGRAADHPVVVFIDRAERAAGVAPPARGDLHLFTRRLGKLVLVEISPLPAPTLMEHLVGASDAVLRDLERQP